jgi:serine O-acetyltransferase
MWDNLRADFQAAEDDRKLESGWLRVLLRTETPAIICYRFSHWVLTFRVPVLRQILLIISLIFQRLVQMFVGVFISPDAEIGPGLLIHTPYGIIVGPTKIGANCTIQSGVVITAATKSIGDNVYFGPGAKVIGDARIGNNVVIVANSVVLTDVPDNTTIMGVPARIRLPGGRPKRFKWQTVDKKAAPEMPANGQAVSKAKV